MSDNLSRPSWKQCALLLILLSHAVFGSPIVPAVSTAYEFLEPVSQGDASSPKSLHDSAHEEVFGPTLDERSDRKKRLLYDTLKKATGAKLLTLGAVGAASSSIVKDAAKNAAKSAAKSAAKKIGKSVLKTVAALSIKAIIFNFLYSKIHQVLDFKSRLINNFGHQNREQNTQVFGTGDAGTAGSNINSTTTEFPTVVEVSTFDPNKVSLNLPGTLFATGFSVVSSTASIIETLVQNTALRIARLFDALKPILLSSSSLKSKKRETNFDITGFEDSKGSSSEVVKRERNNENNEKTPIKNSYVALTQ